MDGYKELLESFRNAFTNFVKRAGQSPDSIIDSSVVSQLERSLQTLHQAIVKAVADGEAGGWNSKAQSTRDQLLAPWPDAKSDHAKKTRDLFVRFLESDSPELANIVMAIFETAIVVDLLRRGKQVEEFAAQANRGGTIFLDTNCITALLARTNRYHQAVTAAVQLARRQGLEVTYVPITRMEVNRIVKRANEFVREGDLVRGAKSNEFVLEYTRYHPNEKWTDFVEEINHWNDSLEHRCGIAPGLDSGARARPEVVQKFDATFKANLRVIQDFRDGAALVHDAELYSLVHSGKNGSPADFSAPLIVTLDRALCSTDLWLHEREGFPTCVAHATTILAVLTHLCDIEFGDADMNHVGTAILQNMVRPFNPQMSPEEYAVLLGAQHGWDLRKIGVVKSLFMNSLYRHELEEALRAGDEGLSFRATQRILNDTQIIDEMFKSDQMAGELGDMRKRMAEMQIELNAHRRMQAWIQEFQARPVNIAIRIEGVGEQVSFMYERLLDSLRTELPAFYAEANLEIAGPEVKNASGLRKALGKIESGLGRMAGTVQSAGVLLNLCKTITGYLPPIG